MANSSRRASCRPRITAASRGTNRGRFEPFLDWDQRAAGSSRSSAGRPPPHTPCPTRTRRMASARAARASSSRVRRRGQRRRQGRAIDLIGARGSCAPERLQVGGGWRAPVRLTRRARRDAGPRALAQPRVPARTAADVNALRRAADARRAGRGLPVARGGITAARVVVTGRARRARAAGPDRMRVPPLLRAPP